MPLDIMGCTRATIALAESLFEACPADRLVGICGAIGRRTSESGHQAERSCSRNITPIINTHRDLELGIAIVVHERGIPSRRNSSYCVDYGPALCSRPSLLPIGKFSKPSGSGSEKDLSRQPSHAI